MSKVKIKLISIGHLPLAFQTKKVEKWQSEIFEVQGEIDNFALRCDADSPDWEFSDVLVKQQIPTNYDADLLVVIVNVPIQDNYYSRSLGNNHVVFTFYQVKEILERSNIPLENAIFRLLYSYTLRFKRAGNRIPDYGERVNYTHDETRGCLFDMNGIKSGLSLSCHQPIICDECQEKLRQEKVSTSEINKIKKEIKSIQKDLYFRILEQVKLHPIFALVLSSIFALILGVSGSLIGSYAYGYLINVKPETVINDCTAVIEQPQTKQDNLEIKSDLPVSTSVLEKPAK